MGVPRPVVVYDGRCRFCVQEATRLSRWLGDRIELESFRDPGVIARHPGLTEETCSAALQLVEPDGRIFGGAAAIARALRLRPALVPLGWLYEVPVLRQLFDAVYGVIARNRFRLAGTVCEDDVCRQHPAAR